MRENFGEFFYYIKQIKVERFMLKVGIKQKKHRMRTKNIISTFPLA